MTAIVKSIVTPVRLEYEYAPGAATTRFLHGLAQRQIRGARVGEDGPVYVPPRGADPRSGLPTDREVVVADKGTVTTFSIVRVPSENLSFDPPYVCISVLLDGADIGFFHVLQNCPLEDARLGMRVQAVWVDDADLGPTVASIRYFEPIDEPDVPFEQFRDTI